MKLDEQIEEIRELLRSDLYTCVEHSNHYNYGEVESWEAPGGAFHVSFSKSIHGGISITIHKRGGDVFDSIMANGDVGWLDGALP